MPKSDLSRFAGWRTRLKPWALPALSFLLMAIAAVILFSKLRSDVWTYYTDGEGNTADVNDEKTRPVLWQDPEPQHFDEKKGEGDSPNSPSGTLEAAFSADGASMVLVRWNKERSDSNMYLSNWDGRTWSKPQALGGINTDANERSPALSRDGRLLYFASDRKGGLGGYDLYVARWQGGGWKNPQPLTSGINSTANELGPALSADGKQMFFSSDRAGDGTDDIYVSSITLGKKEMPVFSEAATVDDLNSKAADVQAALTSRGDHVFLASDRDRDKNTGFKVYISRVVDGEPSSPEEVDLYIEEGDITDPAVRMDGFDLLFSSGTDGGEEEGYRLYRSTTREVVGYTDSTRWDLFKELMGKIAWWILLAVASLIALIYILEKWQDMTSLFHKCLAGSAILHLLVLLATMALLIVRKIDEQAPDKKNEVVTLDIDALAEEELALESIPEETQLTDTTTNLESEKMESEFGAPGFEAQNEAQAVPDAAQMAKESLLAEAQPAMSAPTENAVSEPAAESALMEELTETVLPTIDAPVLEERDPTEPMEVADSSNDVFEPQEIETPENVKMEVTEVSDSAVESETQPTEVTELTEVQPLVDMPQESVVEVAPSEIAEAEPTETSPLESTMLTDLVDTVFEDPSETTFEEVDPASESAEVADPSEDMFEPGEAVANLPTEQTEGEAVADSAVADSAEAAEGAASEGTGSASPSDAVASNAVGSSAGEESLPTEALDPGGMSGLPDLAVADIGGPVMEEPENAAPGAQADPSDDTFKPNANASNLSTEPAESQNVADSAMAVQAEVEAITGGELVAGSPVIESRPSDLMASAPAESVPEGSIPAEIGSLPEVQIVDVGTPMLEEEGKQNPAGAPADTTQDMFKPDGGAQKLVTEKQGAQSVADSMVDTPSDAAAISGGGLVADSAVNESRPPQRPSNATAEDVPPSDLEPGAMSGLPNPVLVDTGLPAMEEPAAGQAAGAPADTSKDQFKPGGAESLATAQANGSAVADSAVADAAGAGSIAESARDASASAPVANNNLEAMGSLPQLDTELAGTDLGGTSPLPVAMPTELEVDKTLGSDGIAKLIKKQRGKPGMDTIKEMGGSEGSEAGIGAALAWLVKVQEADGRWDTMEFGAKGNYDQGGTGLALLCFYGWGERHDQECKYQQNVQRGLDWLLKQQKENGNLGGRAGSSMLYSHAIATIALCEAYGLTKDPKLKKPAERAIAYTIASQDPGLGGWRYTPRKGSDTSVTGWQYMALHSARMAGLEVPDEPFTLARGFLDKVASGKYGGVYGYQKRGEVWHPMVATGMFCRQLDLVPPSHPQMQESARLLKRYPVKATNTDLYYIYYATLALYQHQGPIWKTWNEQLQEILPTIQNTDGSWDPSSGETRDGGRIISTALATLSLEVYYRLLPMYGFRNKEADAPEVKKRDDE